MPLIDDLEMRQLFSTEGTERLQKLDAGWLQLEKEPTNAVLIEELFREAHSLKGAARMLGLMEIQDAAHGLEDTLGLLRKGEAIPTPTLVQAQLKNLDQLRQWVNMATGHSTQTLPIVTAQELPSAQTITAPASNPNSSDSRIDTIRVGSDRLDFLLSQAGELVVCKNHMQGLNTRLSQMLTPPGSSQHWTPPLLESLQALFNQLSEDTLHLSWVTDGMETGIRALRLLPASTLLDQFPRMVHDLSQQQNKKVDLNLLGGDMVVDKRIVEEMKAPLMHLLRNAVDHGLENPAQRHDAGKPEVGLITVRVSQEGDHVDIDVRDDGQGLNLDAIRALAVKKNLYDKAGAEKLDKHQLHMLILDQGFSTNKLVTEVSGRGVGLNVVRTTVERLHGSLTIDSNEGKGMWIKMGLPVSLISTRVLLVSDAGHVFAVPFENVVVLRKLWRHEIRWIEGRECLDVDGDIVFLSQLGPLLNLPGRTDRSLDCKFCAVLSDGQVRFGIWLDALIGEQMVVIKPTPMPVQKCRPLLGVTILDSGVICPVLHVRGLSQQMLTLISEVSADLPEPKSVRPSKLILLAEDSPTTRLQEKRILENAGYKVIVAADGLEAWSLLSHHNFDAVVSDIMMPRLTGLELLEKIRAHKTWSGLPVILITTLSGEEDRRRGLNAGANAYLSKPEFDQTVLLECLDRLL